MKIGSLILQMQASETSLAIPKSRMGVFKLGLSADSKEATKLIMKEKE